MRAAGGAGAPSGLAGGQRRRRWAAEGVLEAYRESLPFALTGAQERVLGEIVGDLRRPRPMARLLQGDVGSGKTAVAAAALVIAVANQLPGRADGPDRDPGRAALQDANARYSAGWRSAAGVCASSCSPARRAGEVEAAESPEAIASGEVDVIVGTHALIQDGVAFKRLGVAVVDEQHRFGVMQRAALQEARRAAPASPTPHLLVDVGDADPAHAGADVLRRPRRLGDRRDAAGPPADRDALGVAGRPRRGLRFVRRADSGPAPGVRRLPADRGVGGAADALGGAGVRAAVARGLPGPAAGPAARPHVVAPTRTRCCSAFRRGELHILVATTVIEVGIDIPNASVMVIEGADRFGLAQLHQLRGRVGRGADQSYCLLLSDDPSQTAQHRLQLLEEHNDGFALAEADLRLRGPGDYFGTRQSGLPEFQAADFSDVKLIETARREAQQLLATDAGLQQAEHRELAAAVGRMKRIVTGDVS